MQDALLSLSPIPVAVCVKHMTFTDDVKKVITEIIFIHLRKAFPKRFLIFAKYITVYSGILLKIHNFVEFNVDWLRETTLIKEKHK